MSSIITLITVFNTRPEWLREAVISALMNQCKVLMVDDGSTNEATLLEEASLNARHGAGLLLLPHQGMESAINEGVRETVEDYIAILDSDDRMMPGRIRLQKAILDQHPEVVASTSRYWCYISPEGEPRQNNVLSDSYCHCALTFRRSAWEAVGGYPVRRTFKTADTACDNCGGALMDHEQGRFCPGGEFKYGEGDTYFQWKLAELGRLYEHPAPLAEVRLHPGSLTAIKFQDKRRYDPPGYMPDMQKGV